MFTSTTARAVYHFIGTASPAGGNLKEPVTESTRKAARCFYGLKLRARRQQRYPAIDPIDSYSKYLEYPEVQENLQKNVSENLWLDEVTKAKYILLRGKEAMDQINILGDDGVPMYFHETFWKSELIDFIILQQDARPIDASTPMKRQQYMLRQKF